VQIKFRFPKKLLLILLVGLLTNSTLWGQIRKNPSSSPAEKKRRYTLGPAYRQNNPSGLNQVDSWLSLIGTMALSIWVPGKISIQSSGERKQVR
jgi:hypothetical protein